MARIMVEDESAAEDTKESAKSRIECSHIVFWQGSSWTDGRRWPRVGVDGYCRPSFHPVIHKITSGATEYVPFEAFFHGKIYLLSCNLFVCQFYHDFIWRSLMTK